MPDACQRDYYPFRKHFFLLSAQTVSIPDGISKGFMVLNTHNYLKFLALEWMCSVAEIQRFLLFKQLINTFPSMASIADNNSRRLELDLQAYLLRWLWYQKELIFVLMISKIRKHMVPENREFSTTMRLS